MPDTPERAADEMPYDWEQEWFEPTQWEGDQDDIAERYAAGATTPPSPPVFDTREEERMD